MPPIRGTPVFLSYNKKIFEKNYILRLKLGLLILK